MAHPKSLPPNFGISWRAIFKAVLTKRRAALLAREIRKRLYSESSTHILRRDITLPLPRPKTSPVLSLRPVERGDIPALLGLEDSALSNDEIRERINLVRMLKSGIRTGYVVLTAEGTPCHIAWLIDSTENKTIESFFPGRVLPLLPDEILIEGVYTLEPYRRQGIQHWRRAKFFEKGRELGARWTLSYIRDSNRASLQSDVGVGYFPYLMRKEKWRFFRRQFEFLDLRD